MSIYIGCDIEEISRFEGKENDTHFLDRIYTSKELEYSLKDAKIAHHLAVRFCAKEAVYKALSSSGINGINYKDIEIVNEENGVPIVNLIKPIAGSPEIRISLSHCKTHAMAQVIVTFA